MVEEAVLFKWQARLRGEEEGEATHSKVCALSCCPMWSAGAWSCCKNGHWST